MATTRTITTGVDTSTLTSNTNYLQPNGFRVSINRKYFPNLQFFAQSVMHPAMNAVGPSLMVPRLSAGIPMTADSLEFGEVSMMVILDEDMKSYTEMHNWMRRNLDRDNVTPLDRFKNATQRPPSQSDITLSILNSANNAIAQIIYRDSIPVALTDIQFQATRCRIILNIWCII